jgi:hypothetical protein
MRKTRDNSSTNERLNAALKERARLRNRFRQFTSLREPVPQGLWKQLYLAGLEVERLREGDK